MKVGILEYKDDRFANDLMSKLPGSSFVKFSNMGTPVQKDFDVIVDRLSFHNKFLNTIMKLYSIAGTYVINNPFAVACTDKMTQVQTCKKLGIPHPNTLLLPQIDENIDFSDVVGEAGFDFKYPAVLKPYDGYAWEDVYLVSSADEARKIYNAVYSRRVLMLQEYVTYDDYLRCFCIGDKFLFVRYDPKTRAYIKDDLKHLDSLKPKMEHWMTHLSKEIDFDVNTVEWAIKGENVLLIDAYNDVPEFLPTSIPHDYYWWIVDAFAECVKSKENHTNRGFTRTP